MTTTLLKENIVKAVNGIDDKDFLEAVYTIIVSKAEEIDFQLTTEMKNHLDNRKKNI